MKIKFKRWWSTIPPIIRKRKTTSRQITDHKKGQRDKGIEDTHVNNIRSLTRVPLVEHELLCEVRVAQSLIFYVVFYRSMLVILSCFCSLCIICSSDDYLIGIFKLSSASCTINLMSTFLLQQCYTYIASILLHNISFHIPFCVKQNSKSLFVIQT